MWAPPSTPRRRAGILAIGLWLGSAAGTAADKPSASHRLIEWPARAPSPTFHLVDERGRTRTPVDFRGRPFMLLFGFSRCPDVCPAELFKLSAALRQLGPTGASFRVLFVTLDPAHDTRAVLKRYVQSFNPLFEGLTGSTAQVDAAASSFHVNYAEVATEGDYTVEHSSSTFIFDAAGRLRLIGPTGASVRDYIHDLAALAQDLQP